MQHIIQISDQLKAEYSSMNKARRRIAGFILENLGRCSFLPLKELAELTNTTQVTILNFCRDLGYQSYVDFKQQLQDELIAKTGVHDRFQIGYDPDTSEAELYSAFIKSLHQMIDQTELNNPVENILRVADRIIAAKQIFIVAHSITAKPAQILKTYLILEQLDARLFDNENEEEIEALLTLQKPEDALVIAFGLSPYGQSTLDTCEKARQKGISIIAITDKKSSPLATSADLSLVCAVRACQPVNSLTTMMAMSEVLMFFISHRLEKESRIAAMIADRQKEA